MIAVKATRIGFRTVEGRTIWMPARHGIIHDMDGNKLPKCTVFIGPYTLLRSRPPPMDRKAHAYYGEYKHKQVRINVPEGPWREVAKVNKIYYFRRGVRAPYGFHHPFARTLTLEKCKSFYRLNLGACIVDDRGFVFP